MDGYYTFGLTSLQDWIIWFTIVIISIITVLFIVHLVHRNDVDLNSLTDKQKDELYLSLLDKQGYDTAELRTYLKNNAPYNRKEF